MENLKKSTLPLIYIIFAAVGVLSSLTWIVSYYVSFNGLITTALSVIYTLAMLAMVGWASAAGRSIGVNRLGSICGWIYVALALIVKCLVQYQMHLFSAYSFDEITGIVQILNIVTSGVNFIVIVALMLFFIGSRTTTIIKVLISILMLISYFASSCTGALFGWMDIYPAPMWVFHIGNICFLITWLTMLILSIVWKAKN
ncbi:MAG: hypothetical protein K2G21_03160 [Muribaculaceae bacterium]|nr:hypothetical protein [Muribaculaceae bacterium]